MVCYSGYGKLPFRQLCTVVSFPPHSWSHLLFLVFLVTVVLTSVRCLIVVGIYMFLTLSDVELLFMYLLLAICMSCLEKYLVPLPIFTLNRFCFITQLSKFFIYFAYYLSYICVTNIFSYSIDCIFIF